jgi:hypothetical protein
MNNKNYYNRTSYICIETFKIEPLTIFVEGNDYMGYRKPQDDDGDETYVIRYGYMNSNEMYISVETFNKHFENRTCPYSNTLCDGTNCMCYKKETKSCTRLEKQWIG